ncbi:MAG: DUF1858 domain-containing protein [Calditrichia bacterium]
MSDLIITPKTKVLQLIEAYPQLEDILIQYAPAFKKLKNPVLRKTVAKIATLQQAAVIGNAKVEDLINHLRKEVGQDLYSGESAIVYTTQKPGWFSEELIETEFDAKEMLAAGEQPVNQVIADLNSMNSGKIYKLVAPFLPAPLIDKASSLKIKHWVEKLDDQNFNIYFYKEI